MQDSINQIYLLLIFIGSGFLIGIFFDIFRVLRKSFKTPDIITYLEDFLFWIITGIYLIFIIFKFSFGQIRLFMFASLILGFALYILTISKFFIKLNVKIITILKKIISKILKVILYPFKFLTKLLKRIIFKPITFITINVFKIFNKNVKISNLFSKNKKNTSQKKDFTV